MVISKHHMLLFNYNLQQARSLKAPISKHHMLLFNVGPGRPLALNKLFQNIICYCLTKDVRDKLQICMEFQNIICYCLTRTPYSYKEITT